MENTTEITEETLKAGEAPETEETPEAGKTPEAEGTPETGDEAARREEKLARAAEIIAGASEGAPGEKKKKTGRKGKAALIAVLAAVLIAVIAFGGVTVYYRSVFLPGTVINGYDCSGTSPDTAAEYLLGIAASHSAQLTDAEGDAIGLLPLGSFTDADGFTAAVQEFFTAQHTEAGLFGWMHPGEQVLAAPIYAVSDDSAVSTAISDALYGETPRQSPENAHIVLGEDGYTVDPGTEGNLVNLSNCTQAAAALLPQLWDLREESPVITVENGKIRQKITAESEELLVQCQDIDAYLSANVTICFQDTEYTLSPEEIWHISFVELEDGAAVCAPVSDRVRELSDSLAEQYALDGVYAKFHNAEKTREYIYYRVGDTGWILDHDALAEDIAAALESGGDAEVELRYDTSWYWKSQYWYYNVGDTFVEISLDNQYMWYYVDGRVLVETPVVTGNISAGDDTRRGCFRIAAMTEDTYLVGPTWNDHVDYWMPFDDQIGLHDSSWRDEYGGDIYLTDGSHGCVNTPLEAIAAIYENISVGTIVIVY